MHILLYCIFLSSGLGLQQQFSSEYLDTLPNAYIPNGNYLIQKIDNSILFGNDTEGSYLAYRSGWKYGKWGKINAGLMAGSFTLLFAAVLRGIQTTVAAIFGLTLTSAVGVGGIIFGSILTLFISGSIFSVQTVQVLLSKIWGWFSTGLVLDSRRRERWTVKNLNTSIPNVFSLQNTVQHGYLRNSVFITTSHQTSPPEFIAKAVDNTTFALKIITDETEAPSHWLYNRFDIWPIQNDVILDEKRFSRFRLRL